VRGCEVSRRSVLGYQAAVLMSVFMLTRRVAALAAINEAAFALQTRETWEECRALSLVWEECRAAESKLAGQVALVPTHEVSLGFPMSRVDIILLQLEWW
jgi:hypothetical protein